jgi:hypothetical protein
MRHAVASLLGLLLCLSAAIPGASTPAVTRSSDYDDFAQARVLLVEASRIESPASRALADQAFDDAKLITTARIASEDDPSDKLRTITMLSSACMEFGRVQDIADLYASLTTAELRSFSRSDGLFWEFLADVVRALGSLGRGAEAVSSAERYLRVGYPSAAERASVLVALGRMWLAEGRAPLAIRYFTESARVARRFKGNAVGQYWIAVKASACGDEAGVRNHLSALRTAIRNDDTDWAADLRSRAAALEQVSTSSASSDSAENAQRAESSVAALLN